jgi:hypothetical protein
MTTTSKPLRTLPGSQIQTTILDLQKALIEFNEIPEGADSEIEQLKKKTRDLIAQLNEQIRIFDL